MASVDIEGVAVAGRGRGVKYNATVYRRMYSDYEEPAAVGVARYSKRYPLDDGG